MTLTLWPWPSGGRLHGWNAQHTRHGTACQCWHDAESGKGFCNFIIFMMTSSNGNIFRVTGPLCEEFTGHQWIPRTKASDAELWCLLWSAPEHKAQQTIGVSCGGHHRPRRKTTTGSALDGAVFDIAQILAYLVHNMSRSQIYLGFGHFGWLPSFFGQ